MRVPAPSRPAAWRLLLCRLPVPDHRRHGPGLAPSCQASPYVMTQQRATIDLLESRVAAWLAAMDGCKLQISLGEDRNELGECTLSSLWEDCECAIREQPEQSPFWVGMAPSAPVSPNFLLRGGILSEEERSTIIIPYSCASQDHSRFSKICTGVGGGSNFKRGMSSSFTAPAVYADVYNGFRTS